MPSLDLHVTAGPATSPPPHLTLGTPQTFSDLLADGAAPLALTKTGAGIQRLISPRSYSGPTTLDRGTLHHDFSGPVSKLHSPRLPRPRQ